MRTLLIFAAAAALAVSGAASAQTRGGGHGGGFHGPSNGGGFRGGYGGGFRGYPGRGPGSYRGYRGYAYPGVAISLYGGYAYPGHAYPGYGYPGYAYDAYPPAYVEETVPIYAEPAPVYERQGYEERIVAPPVQTVETVVEDHPVVKHVVRHRVVHRRHPACGCTR